MPFRIAEARKYLQIFDLSKLFVEEMGWDRASHAAIQIAVNGDKFSLTMIAQKRGFAAYLCSPMSDGKMPDAALRYKIETQVRKYSHEHLIIFTNQDKTIQKWQWVRREKDKPLARREYEVSTGKKGEALLQRLQDAVFEIDEEDELTIAQVGQRMKKAFDMEKVTKRFYERFKDEHESFLKFIKGIPDKEMQRWYVSVTLNRLMFIYFIQKKQFLNNDPDYLRHHLEESKKNGKDKFYTDFLCPLFFEGFAKKKRSAEIKKLLGNVPYLNGGIFEQHQIEELHGEKIQIPDKAFDQLFDFFDDYRWHLDERPNKDDKEINPDVLGYIFEKYINQKQMGAYYTKEDITEYISKNTIIPHLFDVAQKECKVAFEGEGSVWRHLQADPDRYIYEAVRKGADKPLPAEITAGESDPKRREGWNKPASEDFALPTEIWREVVARRRRYQEVKGKLSRGEVQSINDLITLNLDIRQFAQDVIQDSDADLLLAFWKAISQIKVLDPTVGSGAFLFAALNVLEPLYEACVERMSALVEELDRSGEKHSPKKYEPFRKVLEQVRQRPDEDYFIFKSIIINNLYGVDIMEEAVEICKLRLFLKLASQVEPDQSKENLGIEPLPDIDFNIRPGNTLVGFATREDVERSVKLGMTGGKQKVQSVKLFSFDDEKDQLKLIEEKAEDVDRLYKLFRQQQTEYGGEVNADDKKKLEKKLEALEDELNILLAKQYAIHNPKGDAYKKWLESHTPFHWFVEFFGIMNDGGFDVIVGNPPYVEYPQVRDEYTVSGYETMSCNNLYAFVTERSATLLKQNGLCGFIVPISAFSNQSMEGMQKFLKRYDLHVSTFHQRPAQLFDGVLQRLSIFVFRNKIKSNSSIYTTTVKRWYANARSFLFQTLEYVASNQSHQPQILKLGNSIEVSILEKFLRNKEIKLYVSPNPRQDKNFISYRTAGGGYWVTILTSKFETESLSNKTTAFIPEYNAGVFMAALNSSLFWWYYFTNYDLFNLKDYMLFAFRLTYPEDKSVEQELVKLSKRLEKELLSNSIKYLIRSKTRGDSYTLKYQNFKSKSIIDEIDRALARHYGLSDEELDFIINYDVKYRMGVSAGEEGDDE